MTEMAKPKKITSTFENWDQVDQALKEIGEIDRKVTIITADMNETINLVKATAEDKTKGLQQRKEALEKDVQAWTEEHIDDFKTQKSRKLLFGEVGFRKRTGIITRNVKAIIEALKQNKMTDCIDVTEKLNKEKLADYDDESILKVGAKRQVGDAFFYKVSEERIGG
jgi:phage host-nuclease inhibitor protein Gam